MWINLSRAELEHLVAAALAVAPADQPVPEWLELLAFQNLINLNAERFRDRVRELGRAAAENAG